MNTQDAYATVRQAAGSIEYCRNLVCLALQNKEPGIGWQWSKTIAPQWSSFQREVGFVEYAPYNYQTEEQVFAGAFAIYREALKEVKFFELITLVESNIEDAERGIIRTLRGIYPARRTRKGFKVHPKTNRVTWKDGVDFRSAAPYIFVRLDGLELIRNWPYPGARSNWLD